MIQAPSRTKQHRRSRLIGSKSGKMLVTSLSIATLGLLGACETIGSPRYHEHRTLDVAHVSGQAISIENANGAIHAIQEDREDVHVEYTLYGPNEERLFNAIVHATRMDDQSLRVWVDWPGGERKNNEGAKIIVNIPDAIDIHARSSNGQIMVEGLSGHAQLDTSNGSITIKNHDGSVFGETTNGRISAEHISDHIEFYTSNGRVYIADAFGPIHVETSNGKVYASTMDGNVGPVRIRSSNGSIDLDLGLGFEGHLNCQTSNGSLSVSEIINAQLISSSKNRVELKYGDSDEVSALKTSNGSIRIKQRQ